MRRLAFVIAVLVCAVPACAEEAPAGFEVPFALAPPPFLQWLPDLLAAQPFIPVRPPAPIPPHPVSRGTLDRLIAAHAEANGVPQDLVHRVVKRESRYDPAARGRGGAMGLMQIKHATARGLGYAGPPAGLLDPNTNLTYAVRYLAGALHAAAGNPERAYALYRSGYHKGRSVKPRALARAEHKKSHDSEAAETAHQSAE
jgi:soluble lytic murein transglycosylase-like protein